MKEIRLAKEDEVTRQKEIWQLCFGDPEEYRELFFCEGYKADNSLVLLIDEILVARLTIIAVELAAPFRNEIKSYQGAMLYGVATHPDYQRQGLARELMTFTNQYLQRMGLEFSIVVPAEPSLFEYYRKLGYREAFSIREISLTREMIENLVVERDEARERDELFLAASPADYNYLRNTLLQGKLALLYQEEDIAYQQKISQMTGADLYILDCGAEKACLVAERMSATKLMIKELLGGFESLEARRDTMESVSHEKLRNFRESRNFGSPAVLSLALQKLATLPEYENVQEFLIRTPVWQSGLGVGKVTGVCLGGEIVRPFGMLAPLSQALTEIFSASEGYLGLAFD